ncbi:MAG TPA: sulfatase-like hydrolase/transferase [Beijerinckiaceae bacterium]
MSAAIGASAARRAAAVLLAAVAAYLVATEGGLAALHAGAATGLLAALFALATGRVLVAAVLTAGFVAAVASLAHVKRERTDFILHAWDVFEPAQWRFVGWDLPSAFPLACAVFALALASMAAALVLRRREPRDAPWPWAAAAVALCAATTGVAAHLKGEPRQLQYTWSDLHLSSFYSSIPEALEAALRRGRLFEMAPAATGRPFDPARACAPAQRLPHILLIHQESVAPPSALPGLAYDKGLDAFFRSHDGRAHALRVETYGGASWLTEFSVLTGMSSRFFGGMRNFVQIYMAGRVDDALPATLARCGFRTVMFYPYLKGFFGSARFFESVGLRDIRDSAAQKVASSQEPDHVYYANALDEIARHVSDDGRPLFLFVQTMAAHWPYDVTYWPERVVAGGGADPEMHEYLRRLAMARIDYDALKRDLATRFPGERFLIVHYGDHQPLATRRFFGFDAEEIEEINARLPPDSPAMRTYFAVDAVNHAPPPLDLPETVDAAYLGAVLLQAAGLPLPDSWQARLELLRACGGRYADCPDRAAVLAFHRRLVESGLVRAR